MEEIWKPIKKFEKFYEISNFGNVKSLRKNKILKPHLGNQYYQVTLYGDNKYKKIYVIHRLVAQAFIPNPENKPTVNHKDENKLNNHVENLEWASHLEQNLYGTRMKRMKEKLYKKVNQYDLDDNFIKQWNSILEAENELKIAKGKITECCKHYYGRKTAGGFIWRYVNE